MKLPSSFILHSSSFICLSLLFLAGCTSFNLSQTNRFIDDDGQTITVDYGTGDSDHVSKFKSPMNGREFEFKSKLRVRVYLPDGTKFYAFQCMNDFTSGTLYKSDDEEWAYHANGFTCSVYKKVRETQPQYEPVFQGVVCQSPVKPRPEQRR